MSNVIIKTRGNEEIIRLLEILESLNSENEQSVERMFDTIKNHDGVTYVNVDDSNFIISVTDEFDLLLQSIDDEVEIISLEDFISSIEEEYDDEEQTTKDNTIDLLTRLVNLDDDVLAETVRTAILTLMSEYEDDSDDYYAEEFEDELYSLHYNGQLIALDLNTNSFFLTKKDSKESLDCYVEYMFLENEIPSCATAYKRRV